MDTTLPTIKTGELACLAEEFARELASRLEEINQRYPYPTLNVNVEISLKKQRDEGIPWPESSEYLRIFESVFCSYIASYYVITPSQ